MKKQTIALALILAAGCARKHPQTISVNQGLPPATILKLPPNTKYRDVLVGEYQLFYERDPEAIQALSRALENDPHSNFIKVHLAYEYAKTENLIEAVRLLEEVIHEKPNDFDALFLYARVLAVKGDFERSKDIFLKILGLDEIQQDPDRKLEVSFILASLYVEKSEYSRAEELLKQIIEEYPDHLLSHYYLARVYSELNRMESALKMYEKTVEIDSRFSLAWRAIGLISEYFKKWDKAIVAYAHVIELEPANIDVRTRMIDIYLQQNQPQKAIDEVKMIKKMYPTVSDVSRRLGLFYYQEKMFTEAEQEFTEAIRKFKTETDFHYYLGLTQYQMGKKDLAQKSFTKVTVTAEIYPLSQLALASLLEDNKQRPQARQVLEKAIKNKPSSVEVRAGLSNLLVRSKDLDGAKKVLEDGLVSAPKEERYLLGMAEIYDKRKQYDDQEKILRSLLSYDPDNASALNFLGYSYVERNIRLPEAEDMIRKAISIRPDDAYIQDSLGWLYYRKNEFSRAEILFRKALEQIPNEPIILEHLADTLVKMEKKKDALAIYQKILELQQDPDRRTSIENKIQTFSK